MISVSLRADNVINGFNPNDLSGNTGWACIDAQMPSATDDEYGVPLYKLVNGAMVERSQAEREAERPVIPDPEQPIEERMTAVEDETEVLAANLDYVAMMTDVEIPTAESEE